MNKETKRIINDYLLSANELAQHFIDKYFPDEELYWIGREVGGVLGVSDYFFDVDSMIDYLKYNCTFEQMSEHYWYELECNRKNESPINIKNYLKLKKNGELAK